MAVNNLGCRERENPLRFHFRFGTVKQVRVQKERLKNFLEISGCFVIHRFYLKQLKMWSSIFVQPEIKI